MLGWVVGEGCPRGGCLPLPAEPHPLSYRQRGSKVWPAALGQDPRLPAETSRGLLCARLALRGVRCPGAEDRAGSCSPGAPGSGRHFLGCCSVCGC